MTRRITLEIEELEERIAPHCWSPFAALGGGHAEVNFSTHPAHGPDLCVPGHDHGMDVPAAAANGLARAVQGGS